MTQQKKKDTKTKGITPKTGASASGKVQRSKRKVLSPSESKGAATGTKVHFDCKYFKVVEEKLGDKGKIKSYFYCQRPNPNTVHILALTEKDEAVLVKQFRPAVGLPVIELPAGICDREGEGIIETAERELMEETGYTADEFELLFSGSVSPGITNEIFNLILATPARRIGKGGGVDGEAIEVILKPRRRLLDFLMELSLEGEVLVDSKIPSALAVAEKFLHPEAVF